eukprot:scaffold243538_cov14-Prasinocladus_malaysianus.AAC.1
MAVPIGRNFEVGSKLAASIKAILPYALQVKSGRAHASSRHVLHPRTTATHRQTVRITPRRSHED